ncbi:MAG TPA: hypothetical protein VI410_09150, partial [Anaerolineales bacterium]|nr:hypothetical protein [Anaerolineales bacterium]
CRDCHTEHQGAQAAITLQEIVNYPHDRTGFTLLAHAPTAAGGAFRCMDCHPASLREFSTDSCEGCHNQLDSAYTVQHLSLECAFCHPGARTVLALQGAPTRCLECHASDDVHSGRLGQVCESCHTPQTWEGATLDHALTGFPLLASHATADCLGCHVERQWSGIPRDCTGCHSQQDPHAGQFAQDCDACHSPTQWSEVHFDHQQSAYPLAGSHRTASCSSCHANGRYVGTPTACIACHAAEDEHDGRFGQDCAACHEPSTWDDVTFDHSLSRFPLTGAHRSTACLGCHESGSFAGTPTACSACHAEPGIHRGVFGTQCASCHSTSAWLPATWNGSHSFPMNHGGAGGKCSTCHPSSYGQYTCYECHNRSEIEKKHREEVSGDFSNCVRCHPNGNKEEGGGDGGGDDD